MSAFENIAKKIAEKNAEIEKMKKAHMKELQTEFNDIVKQFFEECPKVQAVVWSQYTPYFNDGEECIFGMNEAHFIVEGFDEDDLRNPYEYEDEKDFTVLVTPSYSGDTLVETIESYKKNLEGPNVSDWAKKFYPEQIARIEKQMEEYPGYGELAKLFYELLGNNEELLQEVYGDHAAVYLMPGKVIVEEYSHD